MTKEELQEVILINNIPYYLIRNGTTYDYAPIPKEFKIYFDRLQQENKELHNKIDKYKNLEQSLTFIKNRVKQGMTRENVNKCAINLVNSYLKDSDVDE